jgi:hypothetical protein
LPLANDVTDPAFGAKHAFDRRVDVPVARVARDLARLTCQRQRRPLRDDGTETVPARLDHHIGVVSGYEVRTEGNREVAVLTLDRRLCMLPHPSIHQNSVVDGRDQMLPLASVHGDGIALSEGLRNMFQVLGPDRAHTVQGRVAVKNGIGECHPASSRCGLRFIVEDDAVTFLKQAVRYRGPDVAHTTHEYQHGGRATGARGSS